jgi:hypothetical protein
MGQWDARGVRDARRPCCRDVVMCGTTAPASERRSS